MTGRVRPRRPAAAAVTDAGVTDAGMTMMDVVVSMTLMAIFMAIFTGGTVRMYRSAARIQATADAQAQITTAFLRLDKELRYAAGISAPKAVGSDWYVEYLTTNTGVGICSEMRLNAATGQLQQRGWRQGVIPLAPSPWVPLATSVASDKPFTYWGPDTRYNFQRLQLRLDATVGTGDRSATKHTDITFTAMNTTLSAANPSVCTEGRAVA
ncbi:MAG: hypothetical protein V7637_3402 [Mycobacteriales bacterium]